MVKVTLKDGTVVEGTSEEIYALDLFVETDVVEAEEVESDYEELIAGDYVVFSDNNPGMDVMENVKQGKPYYVHVDGEGDHYIRDENDSRRYSLLLFEKYTKVNAPEVEVDPFAQAEVNEVFTDAGRKPNEYREGDIVKIIGDTSDSNNAIGDIGEVTETAKDGTVRVHVIGNKSRGNWSVLRDVKPLVFVENRLDRN